jgi:hypothetical protein
MMKSNGKYASAEDRWAGLGPYYAMFPAAFANQVVARYSKVGDTVLDPFAGRGTALFSSVRAGRKALGIEVNPVGWIYSKTKLNPAPREKVLARITNVESHAAAYRISRLFSPAPRKPSSMDSPFCNCFAASESTWPRIFSPRLVGLSTRTRRSTAARPILISSTVGKKLAAAADLMVLQPCLPPELKL